MPRQLSALFFLLLCVLAAPASAQDVLMVRAGVHPEYSRLVFDWDVAPGYEVVRAGASLSVKFDSAANADITGAQHNDIPNISGLKVVSAPGAPLEVTLTVPENARVRDFTAGSRVVLDIYHPEGTAPPVMTARREKKEVIVQPQPAPAAPEVKSTPAPVAAAHPEAQAPAPAAAVQDAEEVSQPHTGDHVITISSTTSTGLAAFERAGNLWIVVDDPGLSVEPQLAGPQKGRFPPFARQEFSGGIAYRLPLPEGLHAYGEGGGLLWKIVLTPETRARKPAPVGRSFDDGAEVRGGHLAWPLSGVRRVIDLQDPQVGDMLKVVTVDSAAQYSGGAEEFVELNTLPGVIGLAVVPRVDDLSLMPVRGGVVASRPQGLVLSRPRDTAPVELREATRAPEPPPPAEEPGPVPEDAPPAPEESGDLRRIYNFARWEMGGIPALESNQNVLMAGLGAKPRDSKVEDLLTLAKLTLANNRSHEALGYLRVAQQEFPEIADNPEFIALRGAAAALAGKHDEAIDDFAAPALQAYGEIGYWKAVTLAGLEDWQQAMDVMPAGFDILTDYPLQLRDPVTLVLAEVALRGGSVPVAQKLLGTMKDRIDHMSLPLASAWKYLSGEAQRQLGDKAAAMEIWTELAKGKDDFYHAKAGLALTRLELEEGKITPAEAIDRLEALRYAWRGDELETQINHWLGKVYIDNGEYLKGMSVLRNAVSLSPDSKIAQVVTAYMTQTFRDLFEKGKIKEISPVEAVGLYDEFKDLIPPGVEGDRYAEDLAERMVEVDLMDRAAVLLDDLLTRRLQGAEAGRIGVRLAAIRLIDDKPEGAVRALEVAEEKFKEAGGVPADRAREITLLRARALSKLDQTDEALALLRTLPLDPDVNRLRADIAWGAGYWEDAAEAFLDLILVEDIAPAQPLTAYQAELILNRAIALSLSGNRVALSNMRERFGDGMRGTDKAELFEVVARPHQIGLLGSRDSVTSLISEVDLFQDFLDSYRGTAPDGEAADSAPPSQ